MSRVYPYKVLLGSCRIGHENHMIVKVDDGVYTSGLHVKDNHINTYENTTYTTLDEAFKVYLQATLRHRQSGAVRYAHVNGSKQESR